MPQITEQELLARAHTVTAHSYSPYSRFAVGAALLLVDGTIITGTNVENASYGLAMCAERSAVYRMIAEGGYRRIEAVAVVGAQTAPVYPCGACRQVLHEFGCERVIVESLEATPIAMEFSELLPEAFGPESLES